MQNFSYKDNIKKLIIESIINLNNEIMITFYRYYQKNKIFDYIYILKFNN